MAPEKLVQEQLDAYNARDLDRFCACFHPEVKLSRLVAGDTAAINLTEFRELYRSLFDSSPELHCELRHRVVLNEAVVDEEFLTGAIRFPQGLHAVVIYGFRDGLIDRVWTARS